MNKLISKWAPPDEKGKFVACLLGTNIGTVLTWTVSGFIIESIGWIYAFYIAAILVAAFGVLWYFVVYDKPSRHPRILASEREYIEKNLTGITNVKV